MSTYTNPPNRVIISETPRAAVTVNETAHSVIVTDADASRIRVVAVGTPGAPGRDASTGNILVGVGTAGTDIVPDSGYGDINIYAEGAGSIVAHSNIVPSGNVTLSLGSPDRQWREIYVSEGTIFIGTNSSISGSNVHLGNFNVSDEGTLSIPGVSLVADPLADGNSTVIVASDIASRSLLEAEILAATGNLSALVTVSNSNLVVSVNETYDYVNGISANIGNLLDLAATTNTNVVAAINAVTASIGDLDDLQSSANTNLVVAVNEAYNLAVAGNNDIIVSQHITVGDMVLTQNSITAANDIVFDGNLRINGSLYVEGEDDNPDTAVRMFDSNVHTISGDLTLSAASGNVNVLGNATILNSATIGRVTIDNTITPNVSVGERVVSSFDANSYRFAKLIVNTKDLTYGQYQTSEILLTHDGNSVRLTEYAILHTSTQPFVTYNARIVASNVQLLASTQSSDNEISVIRFLN